MDEYSRNKTFSSTKRINEKEYDEECFLDVNQQDEESNFIIENNPENNKILEEKEKLVIIQELQEKLEKEKNEKYKMQIECMKLKKMQEENKLKKESNNIKNFLEKNEIKDKWIKFAKNDITENLVDFNSMEIFHLVSELFILCSDSLQKLFIEKYTDILRYLNIPNTDTQMKNIREDLKNTIKRNMENVIFNNDESEKFLMDFKKNYAKKCLNFIKKKDDEFFQFLNDNSFKSMLNDAKNIILFGMFNDPNLHFEIEKDLSKRTIEEIKIKNDRENYIIVNDPGLNEFNSIVLLNPPVTSSGNEISELSYLKKIIIKYEKNETIDYDFSKTESQSDNNSNINDDYKDYNYNNLILKPSPQSSTEIIKNKELEEIPKYETNTGTRFEMLKHQNKKNENEIFCNKSSFVYDNFTNPITSRLENKKKYKNSQNKSKIKEFSREHEHLKTDTKEFINDTNILYETPNEFNSTQNYKKNIIKNMPNKFEYEKILSAQNKNVICNKNLQNTYHLFNKRPLTKKKSTINPNSKREKIISSKKCSSNNPKKFITKKKDINSNINNYNNNNPGTTRVIQNTKKYFTQNENENNNNNYNVETILSSPVKDSTSLKKLKENKINENKNSNYYRIDSENSINPKTECHIQNVNINLININQTNRVISQNPKMIKINNNTNFNPPQYFDFNEVDEVSKCVKEGLSKNKTLIIKVKKGKKNPHQKGIMISDNIGQNEEENLNDESNQYQLGSQEGINLFNNRNKHSLLKLNKGKIIDNMRVESPSSLSKKNYLHQNVNNHSNDAKKNLTNSNVYIK